MTALAWVLIAGAVIAITLMAVSAFLRNAACLDDDEPHRPRLKSIRDDIDEDRVKRTEGKWG